MNDLSKRLRDFEESLTNFKAETFPSWQTGQIFNALLASAKEALPDDPVIQAIAPVQQRDSFSGQIPASPSDADVGSMRAAVKQMVTASGQSSTETA